MTILRNALTSLPAFGKTYRPHAKAPKLEIVSRVPSLGRAAPPVLFIHGTWHAAWCWSEHFLDYFAANGFAAYALSLRGHGASEGHGRLRFVRVRDFVQDIASVAASLPAAPVLVGHSMGGFLVQKFLEEREAPVAVLMASAPPTGVWPMFARLVRDHPIDVIKSNLKFSLWPIISDPDRARRMLFSSAMPSEEVSRFHRLLQDDSVFGYLDSLMFDLVATERVSSPVLVMGAGDDVMVTAKEIELDRKRLWRQADCVRGSGARHDAGLRLADRRRQDHFRTRRAVPGASRGRRTARRRSGLVELVRLSSGGLTRRRHREELRQRPVPNSTIVRANYDQCSRLSAWLF